MSIESKIAQILEETKNKHAEVSKDLEEEAVVPTDGEEEPNVKRNNTNQTVSYKSTLKKGDVKANASAPEASHITGMKSEVKEELDIDVSDDVAALLNGENLSEEFQQKATTIFEAAVVSRVKQEMAKLEEQYKADLAEQVEEISEGLIEHVDGYLNLVVEQWIEDNAIALESGMKSDILENFVHGLKTVFEENYIEIPEEKFDVLSEMEVRVAELEEKLNESFADRIALKKQVQSYEKDSAISEVVAGLSEVEIEKFKSLTEELSYEDLDTYKNKLQTIRENYFDKKAAKVSVTSPVTSSPVTEEKMLTESMSMYVKALGKTSFN